MWKWKTENTFLFTFGFLSFGFSKQCTFGPTIRILFYWIANVRFGRWEPGIHREGAVPGARGCGHEGRNPKTAVIADIVRPTNPRNLANVINSAAAVSAFSAAAALLGTLGCCAEREGQQIGAHREQSVLRRRRREKETGRRYSRSDSGISLHSDGRLYHGSFHMNEKSGRGAEVYANGNLYVGTFSQNKKHGRGSFFWFNLSDGGRVEQYHGDWWGGLPDGCGHHFSANGTHGATQAMSMWDISRTDSNMGRARRPMPTEMFTRDSSSTGYPMDRASTNGWVAPPTEDTSNRDSEVGSEFGATTAVTTQNPTKDTLRLTGRMDSGSTIGAMDMFTKVLGWMINNMVRANFSSMINLSMKGTGRMGGKVKPNQKRISLTPESRLKTHILVVWGMLLDTGVSWGRKERTVSTKASKIGKFRVTKKGVFRNQISPFPVYGVVQKSATVVGTKIAFRISSSEKCRLLPGKPDH